jgi:NAD(P)-dependent dehydrogenase (short-subunit alcohol dehydrogenase family)
MQVFLVSGAGLVGQPVQRLKYARLLTGQENSISNTGILHLMFVPHLTKRSLVEVLVEQRAQEFGTNLIAAEQMELPQRGVPLARLGKPWEAGGAVLYLATANFCTGTILNISGENVRAIVC